VILKNLCKVNKPTPELLLPVECLIVLYRKECFLSIGKWETHFHFRSQTGKGYAIHKGAYQAIPITTARRKILITQGEGSHQSRGLISQQRETQSQNTVLWASARANTKPGALKLEANCLRPKVSDENIEGHPEEYVDQTRSIHRDSVAMSYFFPL